MENNKKTASFATMISNINSINQVFGMFHRDRLIDSAQIDFDAIQLEEVIYHDMIGKKQIKNQQYELKVQYIEGVDTEGQIKVTINDQQQNKSVKYLPIDYVEQLLYQSMVNSKELSPTAYSMHLDFELDQSDNTGLIKNVQVTAKLVEKAKKMKMK